MKKMNKKGFTLIELLAVIVILAIIMVIAVPQILNVIDSSRNKAWESNVGLIAEGIELNTTLASTNMAEGDFTSLQVACEGDSTSSKSSADILKSVIDYEDTTITCTYSSDKATFKLDGSGQFAGKKSALECSKASGCKEVDYPSGS